MGATYTLATLITRVRALLNEDTADFWTDAQLTRMVNDAERDIAIRTGCIKNIDTLTATINTRLITFAGYKVGYLEYSELGLPKTMPGQVGRGPASGITPEKWFENGTSVGIEPIPTIAYTFQAYLHDYPSAEMSADAHTSKLPTYAVLLIVLYVLMTALEKDKRHGQAMMIRTMYENELAFLINDVEEYMPESTAQAASDRSASRMVGI